VFRFTGLVTLEQLNSSLLSLCPAIVRATATAQADKLKKEVKKDFNK
jgi:hypothetical protein